MPAGLNLFGSYRHGFRTPSQGQLFQQNSAANTVDLQPVKVESFELGLRGQLGSRAIYQITAYDMTLRDDIITYVTEQNTREALNAGSTEHRGLELSAGAALRTNLRLDASYSLASHRYETWVPEAPRGASPGVSYSGNMIEQAPRDLASALISWTPATLGGGRFAVEWAHLGSYHADAANTAAQRYDGHDLLSLHGSMEWRGRYELFARVTNLLDSRYAELKAYDRFAGAQYTPGAPRTINAGMRALW
jgi:outer membrane receptor protein involved in Fe transport